MAVRGTRSALLEMNVTRPPFNDLRVRRAMAHAIHVDAIIRARPGWPGYPYSPHHVPGPPFYKDLPRSC